MRAGDLLDHTPGLVQELGGVRGVTTCRRDAAQLHVDPPQDRQEAESLGLGSRIEQRALGLGGLATGQQRGALQQERGRHERTDAEPAEPLDRRVGDLDGSTVIAPGRGEPPPQELDVGRGGEVDRPGEPLDPAPADRRLGLVELPRQQLDLGPGPHHDRHRHLAPLLRDLEPLVRQRHATDEIAEVRVQGAHLGTGDRLRDHEPGGLREPDALAHPVQGAAQVPSIDVDVVRVEQAVRLAPRIADLAGDGIRLVGTARGPRRSRP